MGRIIIEYMPDLSVGGSNTIKQNVSSSMISKDESTSQYEIIMCIDELKFYDEEFAKDVELLTTLELEGVSYIEI